MGRNLPKWFSTYIPEEISDSSLFRFKVCIGQKPDGTNNVIEVDMRADLDIDYGAIQMQLEDVPSEFAYWSAIYSEVKLQTGVLERKIKARRGILANKLMQEATSNGLKITDKQIQTLIEGDEELNKLEARLLLMKKHEGKMYFMIEALRMKADNLRSLAGFAKIEMGH